MAQRSALLHVMCAAAEKVAPQLRRDFGEIELLQSAQAGAGEFAANAWQRTAEVLHEELTIARQGYGFITPHGESIGNDKTHSWVIDPIAGFTNFAHAIPHFGVAIALRREGEIVAGALYNPVSDDLLHSEKGLGAFYGRGRLRVSSRSNMAGALVGCVGKILPPQHILDALREQDVQIRFNGGGAADFGHAASGRLDAVIAVAPHVWDVAIGHAFMNEAGGIMQIKGDLVIASNEHLQEPLSAIVHST